MQLVYLSNQFLTFSTASLPQTVAYNISEVSKSKTEYMCVNKRERDVIMELQGTEVEEFKYPDNHSHLQTV